MKFLLKRWLEKWKDILVDIFSAIGLVWLSIEIVNYWTDNYTDSFFKNPLFVLLILALVIIIAIVKNKPKTTFGYHLRGKDNYLEIKVGDAFSNKGALVVPVNDHFDMSLGGNVKKANSIQNQVIQKYYAGKDEHLRADVAAKIELGKAHNIGTTIEVEQNGRKFYLVVNSIKKENNRVKSEIDDFILALNGLWQYIALESSRDKSVTIPLINTQHGRDSYLSRASAVKEIIHSYIQLSKSFNICEKLIISINPDDLRKGNIDLDELDDYLKYSCKFYRQITFQEQNVDSEETSKVVRIDN